MPKSVYTASYLRFRQLLKKARIDAGLTQNELAVRIGWPQTDISKVERGERRLDVIEFLAFAKVLGIDPGGFLGELQRRR